MKKIMYRIVEHIGTLSESKGGWKKELNLVSWNGMDAKYDIRSWDEDHVNMSKGVTLSEEELDALAVLLNKEN